MRSNVGFLSNSGETLKTTLPRTVTALHCLSDYMMDKEIARGELELLADKRSPVEMPFSAVYYSDRAVSTRIFAYRLFERIYKNSPAGAVKEG